MHSEEIDKKRKEKWYEAIFMIEALGIEKEVVKNALERHLDKMSQVRNVYIFEKAFGEIQKVENPMKDVKEAYSQIVETKLLVKDLFTLLSVVLVYGPSSVEIIGPEKKEINIDEVQNVSNILAGIVHQFAAAGAGGIVISPDKK